MRRHWYRERMIRELTPNEREAALLMIRRATASPDETDYASFTEEQREVWDPPEPIRDEQRRLWEDNLAEVVVTNECTCGSCPSIGMRPRSRADDESRDDVGGEGDWSKRIVLDAGTSGAMLLLFIDDDSPSYLELAPIEDGGTFAEFPRAEDMDF